MIPGTAGPDPWPQTQEGDDNELQGELFAGATRYRWLGKTLAVLTDGVFARNGCPQLAEQDARRQCLAGARSLDGPLVTFS